MVSHLWRFNGAKALKWFQVSTYLPTYLPTYLQTNNFFYLVEGIVGHVAESISNVRNNGNQMDRK